MEYILNLTQTYRPKIQNNFQNSDFLAMSYVRFRYNIINIIRELINHSF